MRTPSATYCNTLQQTATQKNLKSLRDVLSAVYVHSLNHTATHCNKLQQTATQKNLKSLHCVLSAVCKLPLQHTATHCNKLQHKRIPSLSIVSSLQYANSLCITPLPHTATHCNTEESCKSCCISSVPDAGTWLARSTFYLSCQSSTLYIHFQLYTALFSNPPSHILCPRCWIMPHA